jgi:hypothetical protein
MSPLSYIPTKAELAKKVRAALEQFASDNQYPKSLEGLCAIGSIVLVKVFQGHGYTAQLIHGDYKKIDGHCWVSSSRKVYDVTASQFNLPKILIISEKDLILYNYRKCKKIDISLNDYSSYFAVWSELTRPTEERIQQVLNLVQLQPIMGF